MSDLQSWPVPTLADLRKSRPDLVEVVSWTKEGKPTVFRTNAAGHAFLGNIMKTNALLAIAKGEGTGGNPSAAATSWRSWKMHPDRRRAGRAIRKQRRLERERLDHLIATGEIWTLLANASRAAYELFQPAIDAFVGFARGFQTTLGRDQFALTPTATALALSEAGAGDPSQVEVARADGDPVASGEVESK